MMMKSNIVKKNRIFLLILTISLLISVIPSKNEEVTEKPRAAVSHSRIYLDGNAEMDAFFSGNGTDGLSWATAYILSDLEIDGGGTGSCILITDTDRYLIIQECSLENSDPVWTMGGILLLNCSNIRIEDCTIMDCGGGVLMRQDCKDNIIRENSIVNNSIGILLQDSTNVEIKDNDIEYSDTYSGIELFDASNNVISGNDINYNEYAGMIIWWDSDDNTVTNNNIKNNNGWGIKLDADANNNEVYQNCIENNEDGSIQDWGSDNNIHDNNCGGIPGYSLFFIFGSLLGSIFIIFVVIRKKLVK